MGMVMVIDIKWAVGKIRYVAGSRAFIYSALCSLHAKSVHSFLYSKDFRDLAMVG